MKRHSSGAESAVPHSHRGSFAIIAFFDPFLPEGSHVIAKLFAREVLLRSTLCAAALS
jgi:hypothetical protein